MSSRVPVRFNAEDVLRKNIRICVTHFWITQLAVSALPETDISHHVLLGYQQ
jgi:hypothetical protein